MNRQQFTTYLSETLIPDLREADMHATAEDFEMALQFIAEDAERIASLESALREIAETPKQGEPEIADPEFNQNWQEGFCEILLDTFHDHIDLARNALKP